MFFLRGDKSESKLPEETVWASQPVGEEGLSVPKHTLWVASETFDVCVQKGFATSSSAHVSRGASSFEQLSAPTSIS
jgi:hypothetical protein